MNVTKIITGLLMGLLIGILISSYFVNDYTFDKIVYTKITLSAMITGIISGIYAHKTTKELNIFLGSIFIGVVVFYVKFLITGHDFDPVNMGMLTGAIIGFVF
ncbi:MAG: hypothetical protein ACPHXR_05170, partial [Flavicella sp.]